MGTSIEESSCSTLILLQDLDEHEYSVLHRKLSAELRNCALPKNIVIIPIREIEAWLLSDNQAIRRAMKLINNIAEISNPEEIIDPKRKLNEIVYLKSGRTKRYLNTAHNKKIAADWNSKMFVNVRLSYHWSDLFWIIFNNRCDLGWRK